MRAGERGKLFSPPQRLRAGCWTPDRLNGAIIPTQLTYIVSSLEIRAGGAHEGSLAQASIVNVDRSLGDDDSCSTLAMLMTG